MIKVKFVAVIIKFDGVLLLQVFNYDRTGQKRQYNAVQQGRVVCRTSVYSS